MSTEKQNANEVVAKPLTPFHQRAFLLLAALATGAYFCTRVYHPRAFGHLTIGNWIKSNVALPKEELWTAMFAGTPWYSDAWLFEVVLAQIDASFDFAGVLVFKAILVCLFALALIFSASALAKHRFIGYVFALPAVAGVLFAAPLTPELAGFSLFVAVVFCAYRLLPERPIGQLLLLHFIVCLLFANISQVLIGAIISGVLLLLPEEFPQKTYKLGCFVGLGLLALFCTPYLGANLADLFVSINAQLVQILTHQQPSHIFHYAFGFMLMLGACYFLMLHYATALLRKGEVVLIVASVFLACAHSGYVPYALIALSLACASLWGRSEEALGPFGVGLVKLNEKVAAFGAATREGSLFFLAALAIVSIVQLYRSPVDSSALPQAELEFLKSKPQFMPLLHDSFLGGYVLNRFSDAEGNPVLRAAYDERTLQADPQIAYAARQLEDLGPLWKEVFIRVPPKSVLCSATSPLCALMAKDPQWTKVFEREEIKDGSVSTGPIRRWQVYVKNP